MLSSSCTIFFLYYLFCSETKQNAYMKESVIIEKERIITKKERLFYYTKGRTTLILI